MTTDPVEALAEEEERIDALLSSLDEAEWSRPSGCEGWSVQDVVLHLAQTEEAVTASLGGGDFAPPAFAEASTVDELMEAWVRAERGADPTATFERWRSARTAALEGLRAARPNEPVAWAAAPLKPRTLATTRLSEHWIHALDIAVPLGRELPDTDRLWHIARLAHRTIPYAYARAGRSDAPTVRVELEPPDGGDAWIFGDEDATCTITGTASDFCRVAARRLAATDSSLEGRGPGVEDVLALLRTYA